jgi:hypothetical protein
VGSEDYSLESAVTFLAICKCFKNSDGPRLGRGCSVGDLNLGFLAVKKFSCFSKSISFASGDS